ncbi:MAG: NADH-quinone oxidoreductase subunit A [Cytophagales bacterium]
MLSNFGIVLIFIATIVIFLLATFMVNGFLSTPNPYEVKNSIYESGEQSIGGLKSTFNSKYYVIGLAFLLFEVELILLFPWAMVYNEPKVLSAVGKPWFWLAMGELLVFVALLALGLMYIWKKGYFEWGYRKQKPDVSIPDIYKQFNLKESNRNSQS